MKIKVYYLLGAAIFLSFCGGLRKSMKDTSAESATVVVPEPITEEPVIEEPVIQEPVIAEVPVIEEPIKEIEEKLIPVQEAPPSTDQYFVIIGSFRNYNNAINYQELIKIDGFTSVLLKNEKGLHRISVLGTNDISTARSEIKRIRTSFPKYNDTWLLIQVK